MLDLASPPIVLPTRQRWIWQRYRLSLFGRSVLLLLGELAANLVVWIVAVCLFAPHKEKRGVLSLCVVAWTLGLRQ